MSVKVIKAISKLTKEVVWSCPIEDKYDEVQPLIPMSLITELDSGSMCGKVVHVYDREEAYYLLDSTLAECYVEEYEKFIILIEDVDFSNDVEYSTPL